jgi:hypothetical protein
MMTSWFVVPVNPEPWAVGPLGVGRKNGGLYPYMGQNSQLAAFKQAVKESLENVASLPVGEYQLKFFFWRRLDDYETQSGKRHRKHVVDATNLQKATEDALQGVLIDNDRDVKDIRSVIVEQGADVTPRIVICAEPYEGFNPDAIPQHVWELLDNVEPIPMENDNAWPPTGGF